MRETVGNMSIPKKVRDALKERANNCCEACGRHGANNAHHRRNQSQGGQDVLSNLMLLCGSGTTGCHGKVTRSPKWAEERGYTIQGTQLDPRNVAVVLYAECPNPEVRVPTSVLLDDQGGWTEVESVA